MDSQTLKQLLEDAGLEQPELFTLDPDTGKELLTIEEDRKLLAAPGAEVVQHNKHTGKTLEKREALRNLICERLLTGCSIREVCKMYRVGRNTVSALVTRLEVNGKMEPVKRRLAKKLGYVAEMGVDNLIEKLQNNEVPANVLPIVVGVAVDKKALLDGDPTSRTETVHLELSAADVLAQFEALRAPKVVTVEAESTVIPTNPQQTQGS